MNDAPRPTKPPAAARLSSSRANKSRHPMQAWTVAMTLLLALLLPASQVRSLVPDRNTAGGDPAAAAEAVQSADLRIFLPIVIQPDLDGPDGPDRRFAIQMFMGTPDQVAEAVAAGASRVRMPLIWSAMEPTDLEPNQYQWSPTYETWLKEITASGMDLILTFHGNPTWAATYAGGPIDKVAISEFVEFVVAAVERYSVPPYNVKLWEFYNEPDNGDELYATSGGLGYWGYEPDLYAQMLEAVYNPIKQVDPEAQILLGGIAHDWSGWWEEDYDGPFVREFLDGVLQNGGGAYFDVLNFHFYPTAFAINWVEWGPGIVGKTTYLRQKLASYGLDKPVICTEVAVENVNTGTDEIQSRHVPIAYVQTMAADLLGLSWFMLVDEDPGYWKTGLLYSDLTRKPAFYAYQTAVARLSHASYLGALSTAEKGTDAMEAYEFLAAGGLTRFLVAWTNDEQTYPLSLQAKRVLVVDKYDAESWVSDSADGRTDGVTTVNVGSSPVYLYPES